jgi:hypothetical protein
LQHVGRNCCHFFPDVLFQMHRCPWFLFVHLALEISSEEEILGLGTLVPMNIEVPKKYPLSQDRIVVFEIRLHNKSPMLYRPALHGNRNALSLARRALKNKFPTPMVPLKIVLQNRHVFLPDPVYVFNIFFYTTLPIFSCLFLKSKNRDKHQNYKFFYLTFLITLKFPLPRRKHSHFLSQIAIRKLSPIYTFFVFFYQFGN